MVRPQQAPPANRWAGYYRWTAERPPRELLLKALEHVGWERKSRRHPTAVDLGCGAGNETLELLRRGWKVVAIDGQESAARFLERRVPPRLRESLTVLVAPMEDLELPPSDLVFASFSLPFCTPASFPRLWSEIRRSVRPGGHFAGVLFGDRDEWRGRGRPLTFHSAAELRGLSRGWTVELRRETEEDGRSYLGPKHWHYYDLILGKPPQRRHRTS